MFHCHFFIPVFLSLSVFLPFLKAVPLASLAELVWWKCILLDFFSLGKSFFGLLSWLRALLGKVVLVAGLWFSLLGIFFAILFWLGAFPLRNQLLTLLGLPCMLQEGGDFNHLTQSSQNLPVNPFQMNKTAPWDNPLGMESKRTGMPGMKETEMSTIHSGGTEVTSHRGYLF